MVSSRRPIIVEGPDGSGKTTLAKKLSVVYHRTYCRPSEDDLSSTHGPGGLGLVRWWEMQLALSAATLGKHVYDRCFYISDPIYQQAQVDRDLLIPGKFLAQGIMKLWGIEPIIIFCLPPFEVQLSNVKQAERDRLEGVSDKALEKINNAYWAAFAQWSNGLFENVRLYDYTRENAWSWLTSYFESFGMETDDASS